MSQSEIREKENNSNGKVNNSSSSELITPKKNLENNHHDKFNPTTKSKSNNLVLGIFIGIITTLIGTNLINNTVTNNQSTSQSPASVAVEKSEPNISHTVTSTQVSLTPVAKKISVNGTVTAQELIPVMSQADGLQITEVLVDEGEMVNQGQILLRLDDTILKAELKQAQAIVTQAQARLAELKAGARQEELQRVKERVKFANAEVLQAQSDLDLANSRVQRNRQLESEGAIAKDRLDEIMNDQLVKQSNLEKAKAKLREEKQQLLELETGVRPEIIAQAEANLAEAEARVNLIKARLAETNVIAPVSGKIAERNARVGDVTSAFNSQKLLTIIEEGSLELQLKVPETQLNQVKIGQEVQISGSSDSNLSFKGIVREINPVIDSESRQGIVKVNLPQRDNLQKGMFLQGEIIINNQPSLTVPINAVLPQNNGTGTVFLIQSDNIVKAKTINLGELLEGDRIQVLSGLSEGETIAVKGVAYLKDGDKINLTN